jgi:hypothetical protein
VAFFQSQQPVTLATGDFDHFYAYAFWFSHRPILLHETGISSLKSEKKGKLDRLL